MAHNLETQRSSYTLHPTVPQFPFAPAYVAPLQGGGLTQFKLLEETAPTSQAALTAEQSMNRNTLAMITCAPLCSLHIITAPVHHPVPNFDFILSYSVGHLLGKIGLSFHVLYI